MKFTSLFILTFCLIFAACSSEKKHSTIIKGKITVADSVDQSKNYAGIGYLVFKRDSTQKADTLMYAETDVNGEFVGKIEVPAKGIYPVYISRNKKLLASSSLILSFDDTVKITAQLPAYNQTEKFVSKEYTAQDVFGRVNRNFGRIADYANSGKLAQDTLPEILTNWSAIYWSIHTKYPQTVAGDQAVGESFRLLRGLNDSLLLERFDSLKAFPNLKVSFARVAGEAKARISGLESSLAFLENVQKQAPSPAQELQILRNQIEFLADSNQHERAYKLIKRNEKLFNTIKGAKSWAAYFAKETNRLAPGKSLPDFRLVTATDTISKASYIGKYYILEIAGLADQKYQSELVELNTIIQLYKNFGLNWVTVPIDQQITVDAFLKENEPSWTFTKAHNFDAYRLMDSLNVIQVPTRFFVDKKGNIIRKYAPVEFNRMINDVLKELQSKEKEPNS